MSDIPSIVKCAFLSAAHGTVIIGQQIDHMLTDKGSF